MAPDINFQLPEPLKELLKDGNPWPAAGKVVAKGSIIAFAYTGQQRHYRIHDPYPLVIVSDIFKDQIRGINLHMMTLTYIKGVVQSFANNQRFSYANIKGDTYIVSAFRSYKRGGISQLRMLDAAFLQKLMKAVRTLAPGEIEQMRGQIHTMINRATPQAKAQPGQPALNPFGPTEQHGG